MKFGRYAPMWPSVLALLLSAAVCHRVFFLLEDAETWRKAAALASVLCFAVLLGLFWQQARRRP